jgi:hypothetical protein
VVPRRHVEGEFEACRHDNTSWLRWRAPKSSRGGRLCVHALTSMLRSRFSSFCWGSSIPCSCCMTSQHDLLHLSHSFTLSPLASHKSLLLLPSASSYRPLTVTLSRRSPVASDLSWISGSRRMKIIATHFQNNTAQASSQDSNIYYQYSH